MTTGIEWTEQTWNPVVGCTPVSAGCLNCYAATMARRLEAMGRPEYAPRRIDAEGRDVTGLTGLHDESDRTVRIAEVKAGPNGVKRAVFTGEVRTVPERLTDPLHWRKPRRVFVDSMSDLFHEAVPFDYIDRVFAVMALTPRHTYQILTKRPERMAQYLGRFLDSGGTLNEWAHAEFNNIGNSMTEPPDHDAIASTPWPLPNVWLGTSVEHQAAADERIPHLLRCPAAVRFLSCEPLLGPVNIGLAMCTCPWPADAMATRHLMDCPADTRRPEDQRRWARLHWVIVGGESGPHARPCDVAWVRSIVGQCRAAGVPVFVKQLGRRILIPNDSFDDWPRGGDGLISVGNSERPHYQGQPCEVRTVDPKGGDPAEWPALLDVREFPKSASHPDAGGTPAPQIPKG